MSRLETVRIARSAADQRRGRAGRLSTGVCYRLWTESEQAALAHKHPPKYWKPILRRWHSNLRCGA